MSDLRKKAEQLLLQKNEELNKKVEDMTEVVHELQVYQIELELQNRELQEYSEKIQLLERKFFTLFNFSPISYFLFDKSGIIIDCNLKAVELLASSKERILNMPMISFIGDGRKDEFFNFLEDTITSNTLNTQKFTVLQRSKTNVTVEFVALKIYEESILAAAIDITQKEQRDIELRNALIEAKESDKLKSDFLNTISHEIRTPLNAINGFSQMLCHYNLSETKKIEYSENIKRGASQLLKIVEDILIISNQQKLEVEKKNTIISVNQYLDDLSNEISSKNDK